MRLANDVYAWVQEEADRSDESVSEWIRNRIERDALVASDDVF